MFVGRVDARLHADKIAMSADKNSRGGVATGVPVRPQAAVGGRRRRWAGQEWDLSLSFYLFCVGTSQRHRFISLYSVPGYVCTRKHVVKYSKWTKHNELRGGGRGCWVYWGGRVGLPGSAGLHVGM